MEWVTVLAAALALVVCATSWRQHARLREAEARVEAVRAALPGDLSEGPVDAAVRHLVVPSDACRRAACRSWSRRWTPHRWDCWCWTHSLAVAYASGDARAIVYGGETGQATMARVRAAAAAVLSSGEAREERVELYGRRRRVLRLRTAPVTVSGEARLDRPRRTGRRRHRRAGRRDGTRTVEAMRRDFVSNVSHELKTPLGALSVLAEVLADADDAVTRKRLAGRVQDEAGRMSDLVKDLLDLSRVESEEPEHGTGRRRGVVERGGAPVGRPRRRLGRGGPRRVAGRGPLVLVADRAQLVTAVANLVDNAVAHSIPGARWRRGGGACDALRSTTS